MKLIKVTLAFLAVWVLASCNDKKGSKEEIMTVSFDNLSEMSVKLSDLVENCRYVSLDSSQDALLNRPAQIAVSDEYLLITDYLDTPAKLFSADGKFICNLGSIGQGPKQYRSVICPYIDEEAGSFWLLRGGNFSQAKENRFLVFDKEGNVVREYDATPLLGDDSHAGSVVLYNGILAAAGEVDSKYMFSCMSLEGKEIIRIPSRLPAGCFSYASGSEIYPRGNQFVFKIGDTDTVYVFDLQNKRVKPEMIVHTADHAFDEDAIEKARESRGPDRFRNILRATEGAYSIDLAGETGKYYLFLVTVHGENMKTRLAFAEKSSGKAYFVNLINDLDGNRAVDASELSFYNNEYLIVHKPSENSRKNDGFFVGLIKK